MNPLTNMKNVTKLSERELQNNSKSSWHDQYRDSAWIFIGGLPYELTEGDIICIFSQYGEIVNINLIRDKDNGKSKGFCFLCYEDQRSTILAVDNLNGIKVLKRIIRVDHVSEYKIPKEGKKTGEETKKLYNEGCAPKAVVPIVPNRVIENPEYRRETLADQIQADIKLPARLPIRIDIKKEIDSEAPIQVKTEQLEEEKKKYRKCSDGEDADFETKRKKKKKKHRKKRSSSSESETKSEKKDDVQEKNLDRKLESSSKSKSDENNKRQREKSRNEESRRRSRSRSFDTKSKRRSRSRSLERQRERSHSRNRAKKSSHEKHLRFDRSKPDKYRRGSRS